jgi:hypothetical protein
MTYLVVSVLCNYTRDQEILQSLTAHYQDRTAARQEHAVRSEMCQNVGKRKPEAAPTRKGEAPFTTALVRRQSWI